MGLANIVNTAIVGMGAVAVAAASGIPQLTVGSMYYDTRSWYNEVEEKANMVADAIMRKQSTFLGMKYKSKPELHVSLLQLYCTAFKTAWNTVSEKDTILGKILSFAVSSGLGLYFGKRTLDTTAGLYNEGKVYLRPRSDEIGFDLVALIHEFAHAYHHQLVPNIEEIQDEYRKKYKDEDSGDITKVIKLYSEGIAEYITAQTAAKLDKRLGEIEARDHMKTYDECNRLYKSIRAIDDEKDMYDLGYVLVARIMGEKGQTVQQFMENFELLPIDEIDRILFKD